MKIILLLYAALISSYLMSQSTVPLTLFQQFNGKYGYTVIGSSHSAFDNQQTPPPCQMDTSSSATLSLLSGQTIVAAYFIWNGVSNGNNAGLTINGNTISPDFINVTSLYPPPFPFSYFSAVKDVTTYVQSFGNGVYQINNFNLNSLYGAYCGSPVYFAGWNMIVVYSDTSLPTQQLNIYDGYRYVGHESLNSISFPINNINVTDTANAKMTLLSWNGSPLVFVGESILINGDTLMNAQNPPNNPFNGTNSFSGSTSNWNKDVDTYNMSNSINIGDTNANIVVNSYLLRFISTIITSISSELPDATVSLDSLSGQDICENRDLSVNFTVFNVNSNDTLPAGTPISFFVNDSVFVSTVLTPSEILIGDSLALTAMVAIPAGISSPFTLSIIANQDTTQLGVIQESNLTNNVSNDTLLSLNEIFTPIFDTIAPVCQGTNVVLPLVSNNAVAGTWSPAFNNQTTTTYLFIPTDTNCIDSVQMTVQIVPSTLPTFTLADSICLGGTLVFPTVSNNGVIGTWSPVFDNQNNATYTFSPDSVNVVSEACPISAQHAVVIVPQTVPSFSFADSLCIGSTFTLPSTADNGITGAWSASFNNQITTSYTFSPDTNTVFNGCAATANQTIAIIPTLTPTFTIADSMCADVVYTLPATSNENVLGTWSPVFDNQASQNYVFAPNSLGIINTSLGFRCPLSTSRNITIIPRTATPFSITDSICVGANLVLPIVSNNAISGTWSPAVNNQATTTYTFSPTNISIVNNCPLPAQATVIVDPFVQPTFISIDSICQGNIVVLPTVSENLINGSWSPAFDNQATTTYTFTPSDPGCISSAQMTVPVFPLITPSFSIADSLCQGDSIVFPTLSDNNISGTWSPALNTQSTTTYTFTPNANECAIPMQLTVTVYPRLTPSFSITDSLCQSELLVFPTLSDNNISGTWSPPLNNQQTTNYTFTQAANECATGTNLTVEILPTSITFDTLLYCENDLPFNWYGQDLTASTNTSTTLQDQYGCDSVVNFSFQVLPIQYSSFSASICTNDPDFVWAGQNYNQTGSYLQTFAAENGCDSIVTLNLTVQTDSPVDFSLVPWSGCLPAQINFTNNQITPSSTVLWDFGNGQTSSNLSQGSATYAQAGCYDVSMTVTNSFGCVSEQIIVDAVCLDANPIASFVAQNNPLPLINPTTVLQNNSTDAFTWIWNFGDGNQDVTNYSPQHTFPEQAGNYLVQLFVTNENACQDSVFQYINVEQNPLFYVPNAFTPDKNEFNDVFKPVFSENLVVSDYEFKIYNRWGELLFESLDSQMGWDGTFGGKAAQDGVFTYSLTFREAGFPKVFVARGHLVLVR
jgi:gliding motility-associated-like protein